MLARLTLFLFPLPCALAHGTFKIMIRAFTIFCKLNFIKLSAQEMFFKAMRDLSNRKLEGLGYSCPCCGTKHPQWTYFASYKRYLISFEKGALVTYRVTITRMKCSSCEHTHAILPEIIIPYGSYSLIFILTVLRDYYLHQMTIQALCDKYGISHSTLYAWKRLFFTHKKLWLGVLEDALTEPLSFLSSLPVSSTSKALSLFFQNHAQSFLQGVTKTAYFSSA